MNQPEDNQRNGERLEFLRQSRFAGALLQALPADASFRRYFRLAGSAPPALLMDAPPPREDIRPFTRVAKHLLGLGLSAPRLYDEDVERGFLVLEDFGEDTYTRLLAAGEEEAELYRLAIDAIAALHCNARAADIALRPYGAEALVAEAMLLVDWYLPWSTGRSPDDDTRQSFATVWGEIIAALPPVKPTLVLRDFHVDNLMRLPGRTGAAACGLLDFQDALLGPPAYDVVSLLEDARRDIPGELASAMLAHYFEAARLEPAARGPFMAWYRVLGAQRHCKVLGIFVRLWRRDGKDVYLQHLPRVAALLRSGLSAVELRPLAHWLERKLPELLANGAPTPG